MMNLNYIIDNEFFITCPLLATDQFISYCKDRDIQITRERLEQFEKLGIFYPIARVRYPKIKTKIEYVDNGKRYRDLGILKKGEEWSGDIIEEYSHFWFEKELARNWFEENLLWEPSTRPFEPWKTFLDESRHRQIESFYSIFQCYALKFLINQTTFTIGAESFLDNNEDIIKNLATQFSKYAKSVIPLFQEPHPRLITVYICQILSNRYFPHTQSDRRTIQVPSTLLPNPRWDWIKYCQDWDATKIFVELGININFLKNACEIIQADVRSSDPLSQWYGLISFMSVTKKRQLKGNALYAQTLYSMEHMLRLFCEEVTGTKLFPPDEGGVRPKWKDNVYGVGVAQNELEYLEFLANEYHLNPRPKLILVVEGNGEEEQIPRLSKELLGYDFPKLGIEVMNIHGVQTFTGKKGIDKYGALERFIDDHHYRQTFVFVLLDNEGRANVIKKRLVETISKSYPKRRVTKEEYIHIWDKNIEFDNFSNEEIAKAMTEQSESRYIFQVDEIESCRRFFTPKERSDLLSKLYEEKTGHGLSKIDLLKILFGFIISNADIEFDAENEAKRPLVRIMQKVINLAAENYQPASRDIWQKNQESGYVGDLIKHNGTTDVSTDS